MSVTLPHTLMPHFSIRTSCHHHLINRVLKGSSGNVRPGRIDVRTAEYDSGCSFDPDGRGGGGKEEAFVLFLNEVGDNGSGSLVHRFKILSLLLL